MLFKGNFKIITGAEFIHHVRNKNIPRVSQVSFNLPAQQACWAS